MSALAARSALVIVPAFDRLRAQPLRPGRATTFSMLDNPTKLSPTELSPTKLSPTELSHTATWSRNLVDLRQGCGAGAFTRVNNPLR